MPSTSRSGRQPAVGLTATTQPRGTSPSPIRPPVSPSASSNGQPVVTSASTSPQATSSSNAATSQSRNVGQPHRAHSPLPSVSKIWKQCNLTTTLLCTILMVVLGFLLFKPQTLATKLALWESKKDYQEYCKNINQTGSTISRDCLEILGRSLPPPPSRHLKRNLTNVPSQIEHSALSESWISSTAYGFSLLFVILLICLALLRLYLLGRKKAVSTMDMRYGTRRRILDLPDRYTLISSGLAWVPYFVTRSIVSVIRRTVMIHRANELGWSSTIEIDDKPCNGHIDEEKFIDCTGPSPKISLSLRHMAMQEIQRLKGLPLRIPTTPLPSAFDEEKENGNGSDQDEWKPVANLGISNFRKRNPTGNVGVVGGKAERELASPQSCLTLNSSSDSTYSDSTGIYYISAPSPPLGTSRLEAENIQCKF